MRTRELKHDLGAVRATTWVVMRLNSLVRLILLFVETTILLDRFREAIGLVLEVEPKTWCWVARGLALDVLRAQVRLRTHFDAEPVR